jgi:hypothetical protein
VFLDISVRVQRAAELRSQALPLAEADPRSRVCHHRDDEDRGGIAKKFVRHPSSLSPSRVAGPRRSLLPECERDCVVERIPRKFGEIDWARGSWLSESWAAGISASINAPSAHELSTMWPGFCCAFPIEATAVISSSHKQSGTSKQHPQRRDHAVSGHVSHRQVISEVDIDRTLEDSFPASDPPSWTLGVTGRSKKVRTRQRSL